jgi:hypothetical protein
MAILGLARIVGRMLNIDGYVAGLWKKDIIGGLLWYTDGSKNFNPLTQSTKPPTWSWASVGSQSISHCLSKDNYTAFVKLRMCVLTSLIGMSHFTQLVVAESLLEVHSRDCQAFCMENRDSMELHFQYSSVMF